MSSCLVDYVALIYAIFLSGCGAFLQCIYMQFPLNLIFLGSIVPPSIQRSANKRARIFLAAGGKSGRTLVHLEGNVLIGHS